MRILIITDSYPPEVRSSSHLMKEMADGLTERGHRVYVVTSWPEHHVVGGRKIYSGVNVEEKITVIRAKALPHHNVSFILKGISQLFLPYIFFRQIKRNIREEIDIVFVHSPPLPLAIAANLVKNRYGAKFCLNVQDFFPQNAVDLGVLRNPFLTSFFRRMERWAYKNCDFIITPSDSHKKFLIEKRGVSSSKINVVSHWIDIKPFKEAKTTGRFRGLYGLKDKFVFVFGGVLGPSQGLEIFLKIASNLKKYKDIVFLFSAEGSEKNKLLALKESLKLDNVQFRPLVSKEDYPWFLKDADVGFLSLTSANTTPAVPAKLMGYMAAGLPVLAFLHKESDGIKIVREADCGLATVSDDPKEMLKLTEKIYLEKEKLKKYGSNSFEYALSHFTKDVCLDKIERIFESML
ncbi:MAG: Lipopolysaccharide biosynthesis protein [Candidatus Jorgensenbacteria bacterium GW2011_GWA1_48_11]|uniref:Lipopolysaccharide biosynthesis protein n=1 Tax=Candidatus Jorgensenbacteria bacterium GW2011_GWA1_48_11 TaxID=1618660 RepID=A0A0G1UBH5_9BACT|nr:MAG: Lipopolysaccharide biosynthesis protein [Candidatus Jorgensenbacteria bacterium GW2011_GWA1_48_11]KKW11962.1 MAG: Lipopolysaccharide biosynthesis protein [Candidatus Jorgensenbacteria bacterium GW2011_GWB1_49_9]